MNSISVIIPTFNREKELNLCLESLFQNNDNFSNIEVIVSNDNIKSNVSNELKNKFPLVKFVNGPGNGPAKNRNFGAKISNGKWLIFLDDDCIPQKNWLLNYSLEIEKGLGIIYEGKTIADREKQRYDEVSPINLTGGKLWSCNFAIRKDVFIDLNGFDESYPFSTMEDIDFRERAKLLCSFYFVNNSVVVHPWRRRIAFRKFFIRIKSQKYFAKKFYKQKSIKFRLDRLKIFVGSIFSNFIDLVKFKFKGWECYIEKMILNFIMIFI